MKWTHPTYPFEVETKKKETHKKKTKPWGLFSLLFLFPQPHRSPGAVQQQYAACFAFNFSFFTLFFHHSSFFYCSCIKFACTT
jgi:hypothetical protein